MQVVSPAANEQVSLECVYAGSVDLTRLGHQGTCLSFHAGAGSARRWAVGRQLQPDFFVGLVPDEALRNTISRSHFELVSQGGSEGLQILRLTQNAILVNGAPTPHQQLTHVPAGSHVGFCGPGSPTPFLIFRVHVGVGQVSAIHGLVVEGMPRQAPQAQPSVSPRTSPHHQPAPQPQPAPPALQQQWQAPAPAQPVPPPPCQPQQLMPPATSPPLPPPSTQGQAQVQQQMQMQQAWQQQGPCQGQPGEPGGVPRGRSSPPPHDQGSYAPPSWTDPDPMAPFKLVATFGHGCDVHALPLEEKTIPVRGDAPLLVGRQQQFGFFEGVLGMSNKYLTFVSRSHVELTPLQPGCFSVRNLSPNPIEIGQAQLGKQESCSVTAPVRLIFLAGGEQPGKPLRYLALDLVHFSAMANGCWESGAPQEPPRSGQRGPSRSPRSKSFAQSEEGGAAEAAMEALSSMGGKVVEVAGAIAESIKRATSPAPPHTSSHGQGGRSPRYGPDGMPVEGGASSSGAPACRSPRASAAGAGMDAGPTGEVHFWLELGGTAVRQGYPAELRRVAGDARGVIIGRMHQQQLHFEALDEAVARFVSREHFRVARGPDGAFAVVPLGSNLMWLLRGSRRLAMRGNDPLQLMSGDVIQLFTGGTEDRPSGPECYGTLYWMFTAQDSASPSIDPRCLDQTMAVSVGSLPGGSDRDHRPGSQRGVRPSSLPPTPRAFQYEDEYGAPPSSFPGGYSGGQHDGYPDHDGWSSALRSAGGAQLNNTQRLSGPGAAVNASSFVPAEAIDWSFDSPEMLNVTQVRGAPNGKAGARGSRRGGGASPRGASFPRPKASAATYYESSIVG